MEDQERQKKLEAGKAKLAEYRQRKAEADGQKKSKKKRRTVGAQGPGRTRDEEECDQPLGQEKTGSRANSPVTEFTISRKLRSGETVKHDQVFTIEPESEVSTTAEDCTSEEEDLRVPASHSEHEAKGLRTRIEMMDDELAAKQQAMEEQTKELEEIRTAFSTELQNFEAAVNQRDGIITQLTTNLQQARKEKDDIMREFQEMTDRSQKLQIQFQQLQAGENLRNSSHSSTAADLLQARVQITSIQQQVEQRETQAKVYLEKMDEQQLQISQLQYTLNQSEMLVRTQEENLLQRLNEKDAVIAEQKRIIADHESLLTVKHDLEVSQKSLNEYLEQITEQTKELEHCQSELSSSKERELMSSSEIRQLMGAVEDLQKRSHKGSQSESDTMHKLEVEMERKMDRLRAELDEMYGQQIVQMKQELQMQHSSEMDRLREQDKSELEMLRAQSSTNLGQINALNAKIAELQQNVEEVQSLKKKVHHELLLESEEKQNLLGQVENLKQELHSVRKAEIISQSVNNQEQEQKQKQGEVQRLQCTIGHLEAQLAAIEEANRDLESKHESEVTNYKIKLEMLEREKDAVLSMMAESQEAELERVRTQMLFSHEEELTNLREVLQKESALHLENLKDEMTLKQKHAIHNLQTSLQEQLRAMECEKESLATENVALLNKIKVLEERLNQPVESANLVESSTQPEVQQVELEGVGQEEKEKDTDLSRKTKVVAKTGKQRKKALKLQSEKINLKESNKAIKEDGKRMLEQNVGSRTQGNIKAQTVEKEQLCKQQIGEDKIKIQQNTLFEKNIEVNYKELKEEFACLLQIKRELEEEILKVTADYEVKLSDLQSQIQKLQECKAQPRKLQRDNGEADKMEEDFIDGSKLIEKNTMERPETLDALRTDSGAPSEVSEQLVLKDNRAERAMEDVQSIGASNEERDGRREVVMGTLSTERASAQLSAVLARGGAPSGLIRDRSRQIESLDARASAPQIAEGEHDRTQQQQQQRRVTQALETRAVNDQAQVHGQRRLVESSASGLQEDGRSLQQRAPVGETLRTDPERKALDLAAAEQEIQALMERLRMLHTPQSEEKRASQQSVTLRQEEFQLQFEALRISLSQICAAQLELQKESLQAEREACLRRQEQDLRSSHARELQQLCEKHRRELQGLKGRHSGLSGSSWNSEEMKAYFQEQQTQLEEQHSQEVKRLQAYYQQEAKYTEERYTAELTQLKQRLQGLTTSRALLSFSREPQLSVPKEEESEEYKRHAELEQLTDRHSRESQALEQQASPSTEHRPDSINGGAWSVEAHGAVELIQTLERQHQERVEEEIAKVIVQMSVEFAQQTEQTRIATQARETIPPTQTRADELGAAGAVRRGVQGPGHGVDQMEQSFTAGLENKLERSAEVLSLRVQSQLNEASPDNQGLPCGENEESGLRVLPKLTRVNTLHTENEEVDGSKGSQGKEVTSGSLPPGTRQSDISPDVITNERNLLRQANQSLRQVLSDVLKTTAAAEETIGHYMEGLLDPSTGKQPEQRPAWQGGAADTFKHYSSHSAGPGGDALSDSCHGSSAAGDDVSVWSGETETDEGLMSSLHTGAEPQLENEEYLMNISSRLQAAVEKLLVAITETTNQLEHARVTQTELMRESFKYSEEMAELLRRQEELQESLSEEAKARQELALELHRAEGLIDGYTGERAELEQQLQEKQGLQLHLEQELQVTNSRLQELEQERQQVLEERELLGRQQGALKDGAGSRELHLLEETEKLMKEKVEVQRQAEKDSSDLLGQVKSLEAELEEQVNRGMELEQAHRAESSDLRQQIQALEKQLEKNRRFLDEQAVDREHERDVFQQEIMKLEQQLKNSQKQQPSNGQYGKERDQLTTQLQEKSDWCSELLLRSEQLQRDVQDRNEEIERLEMRVREVEQALLASAEMLQVEQEKRPPPAKATQNTTLEVELQTEREALDRKQKEISNLEEQLEQFREELENKSEEVQQLHMQLEIQKKELSSQQQELLHKGDLQKVLEDKNELLRELESQVECMKGEQERLKKNFEEEIDQLNDVIEKLQQELSVIEHKPSDGFLHDAESSSTEKSEEVHLSRDDFDELNYKMKQGTQELETLQASHSSLLEKYKCLREESSNMLAEGQNNRLLELEEALQEKTATCVVMQAQVQALEQSAGYRMASLSTQIEELEACVDEKDSELRLCRLQVKQTQEEADVLNHKISELEDKFREKVAAVLVSHAELGAVQEQSKVQAKRAQIQVSEQKEQRTPSVQQGDGGIVSPPGTQPEVKVHEKVSTTKVVLLTEKLRELEEGLNNMQKDQELQKHLLSSSEEEVVEYEKRLAVLLNLLNQMTTKPGSQRSPQPIKASVAAVEEEAVASSNLLQEVRQEAAATKEELNSCRERSDNLQEELQEREMTIAQLKEELHMATERGPCVTEEDSAVVSKLLEEVRQEAAATKEELNSCRERSDKLQEELQEREMTIAQLKEELHMATERGPCVTEEDSAVVSKLLEEVRQEAAATKEELNSYRERNDKLQEELQVRDISIAQLQEELKQIKEAFAKSEEEHSEKMRETSTKERSSSQMDQAPGTKRTHQTSQTPRAACADAQVQTSPVPHGPQVDSEEIAEVIGEYTERIEQMQDLHAAEIMDMEARHISESESLKREKQALQEECRALKAVVKDLWDSESASPQPEHLPPSQSRDGSMSDSGSDWSQRTGYIPPVLPQEFRTTPEGARRDHETDLLPDRIKSLLREVHQEGMEVLSLSELPMGEGAGEQEEAGTPLKCQGWLKERESLLTTVEKLKVLISTMQIHRERETHSPLVEAGEDWRAELLKAVQQVFAAERSVLKTSTYSHLEQLDTSDSVICLNQLEHKLTEQETRHREAMGGLHSADRTSLLMEVRQLKAQLQHLQQDPGITASLGVATQQPGLEERAGELWDHDALQSEGMLLDELKAELAQTKLELETTLKAQHKHLTALETLRTEVSEKAAEVDVLNKKLMDEQKKSRELQWAFEKEKCKLEKKDQKEREELEDVRLLLIEREREVAQLSEAVEKERRTSTQLEQQVGQGQAQHQSLLSREQSRISELQVQLASAQARALELGSALERERELRQQQLGGQQAAGQTKAADEGSPMEVGVSPEEEVLKSLQSQLDDKHAKVVELVGEVERLNLELIQAKLECSEVGQAAQHSQEALRKLQEQHQQLQARVEETQQKVDRKTQETLQLRAERDQLQDQLSQLQGFAEMQQPSTQTSQGLWKTEDEPVSRTRDWVLGEKVSEVDSFSRHEVTDPKLTDRITNQLQHIAAKIKTMMSDTAGRGSREEMDYEGLTWLQNSVQSLLSQLQQGPSLPLQQGSSLQLPPLHSTALPSSSSSNSLTERLLRQNAELTGFVSRLTEEKNDLRNSLVKLEKELRHNRSGGGLVQGVTLQGNSCHRGGEQQDSVELLLTSAREGWSRERTRLEKCLQKAEAEVSRLRGKIRADSLWEFADHDADSTALKRIYVKYLRAESFRKALIYQKKYLLLLLGSFQDCEVATLSLIARIGGRSSQSLHAANQRPRGFTRFRSVARVFIALSRMKYLVKRWYKTTEAHTNSSAVHRNGQVQITAIEERRESPYLHPGSVDGYGELRGSSRGHTGRDSARFHTAPTETGSLACSHLQNYDPDRALSDYISRLEALQRRLGSVQSGSCSYAQLQFGIRR
ncbi:A-kinase anchor protein 9 isoform X2 [Conger conger]|uniref:A-kinase anchor protein 9 isoform X2 n=1 Tax=Conger conger TaxID=82655 RepID=UPI002A5A72B9|nr:A-kinase anchor protein 9 isoform X2 [Conger conger]